MKLSIAMIVKNEKSHLEELIPILEKMGKDVEIAIVDTGSTDGTKELLKSKNNIIYKEIEWENNFSKARNESISLCAGEYILVLDADERPEETLYTNFLQEIKKDYDVFSINFLHLNDEGVSSNSHETKRLFKNGKGYYFEGAIHEQITNKEPFKYSSTNLYVKHLGYSKKEVKRKNKHKRNKDILLKILKGDPTNLFHRNNLAQDYLSAKNFEKALLECEKALKSTTKNEQELIRTFQIIIRCLIKTKRYDEALLNIERARKIFPEQIHFLIEEGMSLMEKGRIYDGEHVFKKVISGFYEVLSILKLNDVFIALSMLLKIFGDQRRDEEFKNTFMIIKRLQKQTKEIDLKFFKKVFITMNEEELYEYFLKLDINIQRKENLIFEYNLEKKIEKLPLEEIHLPENKILKLWKINKYEQAFKEFELLKDVDKKKILAKFFVYNLERKNEKTNTWLKNDKTLLMLDASLNEKTVDKKKYNGIIYLYVIEELIKSKKFNEFEKILPLYSLFPNEILLKVAEHLDDFYFDEISIILYVEFLKKSPNNGVIWTRLAELLYINNRMDESYIAVQNAIETNPMSFKPIEIMLQILDKKGLLKENQQLIEELSKTMNNSYFIKNIENKIK